MSMIDSMGYILVADCVYAYLHCARRAKLHKLAEVTKMLKNTRHVGSRSFKVIEFCVNRTSYDFLLVTIILTLAISRAIS